MNTQILTLGKTYKIERINYGGETGNWGGVLAKGASISSITVIGSQSRPSYLSDQVDLIPGSCWGSDTITSSGIHLFIMLPEYITIDGDADSIELIGYKAIEDLGELAASEGD